MKFPQGKQDVSETLPYCLLPSYFFATTIVNEYDRSIFNMTGSLGLWLLVFGDRSFSQIFEGNRRKLSPAARGT